MSDSDIVFELQLQRFVDGELSPQQEDDFLACCEATPQRYRELALAMVENRRWESAFAPAALLTDLETADHVSALAVAKHSEDHEVAVSHVSRGWGSWLLGLAASLLAGAGAGYMAAPTPSAGPPIMNVAQEPPRPTAGYPPQYEPSLVSNSPSSYSHSSRPQPWMSELARELEPQPAFPPDTLEQLANEGVAVDQSTHVFLIDLPDGKRLALPAQFINLSQRSQ